MTTDVCLGIHIPEVFTLIDFSYVRYSQLSAKAVRNGLKQEFRAEAAKRDAHTVKHTPWKNGKPDSTLTFHLI